MDFEFSEEQLGIRDLAREILEAEVSLESLKEIEAGDAFISRDLWARLAEANLLGLAVPEALGGMGFGIFEVCVLLQEVGRAVAPAPVLPSLVLAGLPIERFGSDAQKERWLAPLAAGRAILTGALVDADSAEPSAPATTARAEAGGYRLDGRKRFVPAADLAERILVPVALDGGVGLFLVDPTAEGVEIHVGRTSNHTSLSELVLRGARVGEEDLLGGGAVRTEDAAWLHDAALVAIAALQLGVSERAIEITTGYVSEREQFKVPIGSFPAVQHRAADCYIDLSALRWTTWRAAWKLSAGLDAHRFAGIAKFFAAEAGARIGAAVQHLHGGMGADRDYPIHRYFLWSKSLELELGAAMPQLARLGRDMARTGPREFL
jgi:alkylation response protein AidB-like acyl-CoA dehydrogenase